LWSMRGAPLVPLRRRVDTHGACRRIGMALGMAAAVASSSSAFVVPPPPVVAVGPTAASLRGAEALRVAARAVCPDAGQRCLLAGPSDAQLLALAAGAAATAAAAGRRKQRRRAPAARVVLAAAKGKDIAKSVAAGKVVLMGDSVLDNFYWLKTPKRPLRVQLQEALKASSSKALKASSCVNLAVDQMTTFDLAERDPFWNAWEPYAQARRNVGFDDKEDLEYKADEDGKIRSVKLLEGMQNVAAVVLSVGGNDVYLKKDIQADLAYSLVPGFEGNRQKVAKEFGIRYREIVESVRAAAPGAKLVLVIPYRPHQDFSIVTGAPDIDAEGAKVEDAFGSVGRSFETRFLPEMVTPMVREILAVGREVGCPVIDLSRTLKIDEESHYGTGRIGETNELGAPWSGAEPSDISTKFIARLIEHALSNEQEAMLYWGDAKHPGGKNWQMTVRQDNNDYILAEDYKFGGGIMKKVVKGPTEEEVAEANPYWFAIGILATLLLSAQSLMNGGDVVGFERDGFEAVLQQQVAEPAQPWPKG